MGFIFVLAFLALAAFGVYRALGITRDNRDDLQVHVHALKGAPWFALALVFLFGALSFIQIPYGYTGVVTRFGDPIRELTPGPHFILPIADSVTNVNVQTQIVKPSEDAASHDLQVVHFEVTLAYRIDPKYATSVLVNLNDDPENRVITPAILEAIKSVTAQYDAQQLIGERPNVRNGIEDFVRTRLAPYHIIAETTSITNFEFSKNYDDAIEAKVTAQQLAEKAKNDLARIQIQAQQQVAQAQGEADALKLEASALKENPQLLQLRAIEMMKEKWDGQLPSVMVGGQGALPMLDVLKAAQSVHGNK